MVYNIKIHINKVTFTDIVIDIPVMVPPSGAGPPQDPQGSLEPQHQESSLIGKTEANVNFVFDGLKLILSEEVEENSGVRSELSVGSKCS